jgi:acyl carrier protein
VSVTQQFNTTSLDLVELIMSIEEAFDIEISDAASEKMVTVGDLVTFVTGKVDAKTAKAAA